MGDALTFIYTCTEWLLIHVVHLHINYITKVNSQWILFNNITTWPDTYKGQSYLIIISSYSYHLSSCIVFRPCYVSISIVFHHKIQYLLVYSK